eukprot:TRINITY_DN3768_c0_g1_i1.p1 TRINITY_DN3768_c0_g1~~TRINITY_DN3768_c0_g1_i1.p1  ORF type:complete len:343 (+),score=65.90 TRINITY_DN3768_c0_g1_i1:1389-2417(+)
MAQRAGVPLPSYTTRRSGPGHMPVFSCTVEVGGMSFSGEAAKSKKQAEKNAAMVAWTSLKNLGDQATSTPQTAESEGNDEHDQNAIARLLSKRYREKKTTSISHNKAQRHSSDVRKVAQNDVSQSVGDMLVPFNAGGWFTFDFNSDAIRNPSFFNSQHSDSPRGRIFFPPYSLHEMHGSVSGYGQLPDILPSNRLICGSSRHIIPVQLASSHMVPQGTPEVAYTLDEHQREDVEWRRNSGSPLAIRPATFRANLPVRPVSANTMYEYASWPQWINMHPPNAGIPMPYGFCSPVSSAPPVRVRSATAVCSAPPRPVIQANRNECSEQQAGTQVLREMCSLKLE